MKNIANKQGNIAPIEHSEKIFSLHVRYLSALALLVTLFTLSYLTGSRLQSSAEQTKSDRDHAMTALLYASLTDASDALKRASEAEIGEYGKAVRRAGNDVERIRGGCELYAELNSRRLTPYLSQLSEDIAGLADRAGYGVLDNSDRALCLTLAGQIDALRAGDGELLCPEAGPKLDLRISPYLDTGWRLR